MERKKAEEGKEDEISAGFWCTIIRTVGGCVLAVCRSRLGCGRLGFVGT